MAGKTKWKPLELALPGKTVNQRNRAFLEGLQGSVPPPRARKMQDGDSHHLPVQPSNLACAEDSWVLEGDSGLS